jgi:hypothetical protein
MIPLALVLGSALSQCVSEPPSTLTEEDRRWMARAPPAGIRLGVGTQKILPLDGGIRAYGLSRNDVVGVRPLGANTLLVIGLTEGRVDLLLFPVEGPPQRFRLTSLEMGIDSCAHPRWLMALAGEGDRFPRLTLEGESISFTGEVDSLEGYARLRRAITSSWPKVLFLIRPSAEAIEARVARLNGDLRRQHLTALHASWADGGIELSHAETTPPTELTRELAGAAPLVELAREELR